EAVAGAVLEAGDDPWQRILAALDAFLEGSARPAYMRIVLRDARLVLGPDLGRRLDHEVGLDYVEALIGGLWDESVTPTLCPRTTARILLAATGDVAVAMAHGKDPKAIRDEGRRVLVAMLEGIRQSGRRG